MAGAKGPIDDRRHCGIITCHGTSMLVPDYSSLGNFGWINTPGPRDVALLNSAKCSEPFPSIHDSMCATSKALESMDAILLAAHVGSITVSMERRMRARSGLRKQPSLQKSPELTPTAV